MQKQAETGLSGLSEAERTQRMGKLGMGVLIISLSILFAATILGLTVAFISPTYKRPDTPIAFPFGFYISTLLIILSSITLSRAVNADRFGTEQIKSLGLFLASTTALGYLFLIAQVINWTQLIRSQITPYTPNLFVFSLYILTILHSLHVIGGLVPLTSLAVRVRRRLAVESLSNSINYAATYWHFLAVVWYVVVVVLLFICYSK